MGNQHTPADIDPQALKHSQQLWSNFMQMTKYGVIAVTVILALMAAFLVS